MDDLNQSNVSISDENSGNIVAPRSTLKSFSQLIKDSFDILPKNYLNLIYIILIPLIFGSIVSFIAFKNPLYNSLIKFAQNNNVYQQSPKLDTSFALLMAALSLVGAYIWIITYSAMVLSIKNGTKMAESLANGFKKSLSYIFISIMTALAVLGGFLLLIIPGIIFAMWFSFSTFALLFEDKKGTVAMKRSKDLVSGRFVAIFWRLFAFGLVIMLIQFPLNLISGSLIEMTGNLYISIIFSWIYYVSIVPFSAVFMTLLYENMTESFPSDNI
jgi:hypothetical protein